MGESSVDLLAKAVSAVFAKGIRVDRRVQDYVNATFSHPSAETLLDILEDESNCDQDPLLQLLFTPNVPVQEQLEPLLQTVELQPADSAWVARRVAATATTTRFFFPDGESFPLTATVPRAAVFVSGLRADRRLHSNIRRIMERRVNAAQRNRLQVRFRNAPHPVPKAHHLFWKQFFSRFGRCENELEPLFETALDVLDRPRESSPPDAFHRHRVFCLQALERADRDQSLRQGKNIEFLIMGGHRLPHADPAEIQDRLEKIDRICRYLFGGVRPAPMGGVGGEPREIETMEDLSRLVRQLS